MHATSAYEIKIVPLEDYQSVVNLWCLAFSIANADPLTGDIGLRQRIADYCRYGLSYIPGAYYEGKLVAVSAIIDFEMHVGDRWLQCGGIAGVSTYPDHRRRNLVRLLLKNCLEHLHERRVPLSALWPFSYPFYENLGWSTTDMRYNIEVDLAQLKRVGGDNNAYKGTDLDDFDGAAALHEKWSQGLNLSLRRSEFRWQKNLTDPRWRRRLFVHEEGYMIWDFNLSDQTSLKIVEWCYLSERAFRDGLALIAQMDSQYERASWQSNEYQSFLHVVGVDKSHTITVAPGMMSRVVHLESFLEPLKMDLSSFAVKDPLCVSGPSEVPGDAIGPGELVQHTTGFWEKTPEGWPIFLKDVFANGPAFSVEQY